VTYIPRNYIPRRAYQPNDKGRWIERLLPRNKQQNKPYPKKGLAGSPQRRAWLDAQKEKA
jgi:hypothetical protein